MKKKEGDLVIELERTKDILATLGEEKSNQYLVGFAAESENPLAYGQEKLKRKQLDAIVINEIGFQKGFQSDHNEVVFYSKDGEEHRIPYATKKEIAEELMQLVNRKMTEE